MAETPPEPTAVYTCVTNGYDRLIPPAEPVPGVDYILFTDRPGDPAPGWQIREIDAVPDLDPGLRNRYYKLLPHKVLPDHTRSVYLDANIAIIASLAPLLADVFDGRADFAVYAHPSRTTVAEEVAACLAASRVRNADRLKAEYAAYRDEGFPDTGGLTGNSILMRRHLEPSVSAFMELWWDLVSEGSGRDQISLPYLRWKMPIRDRVLSPHFSIASPYFHRYPHWSRAGRRARLYIDLAARRGQSPLYRFAHSLVGLSYRGGGSSV